MDQNNENLKIKTESFTNTYNNNFNKITCLKVVKELENSKKEGKKDVIVQFSIYFRENFYIESDDNCSNKSKH